jgi:hypothetical protein
MFHQCPHQYLSLLFSFFFLFFNSFLKGLQIIILKRLSLKDPHSGLSHSKNRLFVCVSCRPKTADTNKQSIRQKQQGRIIEKFTSIKPNSKERLAHLSCLPFLWLTGVFFFFCRVESLSTRIFIEIRFKSFLIHSSEFDTVNLIRLNTKKKNENILRRMITYP